LRQGPRYSNHGAKRARKRLGLPKKAIQREVERALKFGLRRKDFDGEVGKYVDSLVMKTELYGKIPIVILYGNNVYIFSDTATGPVLITTYQLPRKYIKRRELRPYKENECEEDYT
jgi:hypothetical protein